MTVLLFNDRGWEVVTSAWTAAATPGNTVQICYQWGADHISFFQSATGISRIDLPIDMTTFLKAISEGGVVDLRSHQK